MRLALSFALIFALSACARVKIYDDPWCADAGAFGAECFNTISSTEFSLNKYEWDMRRLGQLCTATDQPGEGYAHIKTAIEKLCADTSFCTPEQRAAIANIAEKVDAATREVNQSPPFSSTPADSASMESRGMESLELQP